VDGEGNLTVNRPKPGTYVIRVAVEGTDPRPLRALQQTFGGSVTSIRRRRKPTHRPLFVWMITARAAEKFLRATVRYMVAKREQGDVLLSLRSLMRPSLKGFPRGYSPQENRVRERLRQRLIAYKHQSF